MNEEKIRVIKLLENLEYSFTHYPFGDLNKFTDFNTLNETLTSAIVDLKTHDYEGITFGIRVNKVLGSINYALAFEGLRLSTPQKKAWHAIYDTGQKGHRRDQLVMQLLGIRMG